jgi:SH3-like domain-containing protein
MKDEVPQGESRRWQAPSWTIPVLFVFAGAAVSACGQPAISKEEVLLLAKPGSDHEVMAVIPSGSAVKLSKCAHGWCQASWRGKNGYVLAKEFSIAPAVNGAADTEIDSDDNESEN